MHLWKPDGMGSDRFGEFDPAALALDMAHLMGSPERKTEARLFEAPGNMSG
jgi:hypothetical protein